MKALLSLIALSGLVSSAAAQQPAIFVDVGSLSNGAGVPAAGFAAAAPLGGAWNTIDADAFVGASTFTTGPLVDSNGTATLVTATYDGLGTNINGYFFDEPNTTGDAQALMDDICFVNGASELRFDGLPAGSYDVFTYAMAPDTAVFRATVDVTNSANGLQEVGGSFAGGFALGVTHAFHTTAVAAGQPLLIQLDFTVTDNSFNGVQVVPSGGGSGLGTNYCGPAVVNTSGSSARIFATGSPVATANSIAVTCADMPQLSFGFFLVSSAQDFVANPAASQGNLCLGGSIGRYVGPGQIQNSGVQGRMSLPLDLTSVPQPLGPIAIQSGETWNWQTWFRDTSMGTPTSNFSDGLQINFL